MFVELLGEAETFDAFMVTSDHEQAWGLVQVEVAVDAPKKLVTR